MDDPRLNEPKSTQPKHFPIFSVSNRHAIDSGTAPYVDGDTQGRYHGYFQNEHGEQALFIYDYQTKAGTLWMGDNGWENPIPITDLEKLDIVLGKNESLWLQSCWKAATEFQEK